MERRRAPAPAAPVLRAIGLTLVAACAAAGLAVRATELVDRLGTLGVDQLVELVVVCAGALVAGWFALSCTVAVACLAARWAGQGWHAGERVVARLAPGLVRRSLAIAVAAGIGLGTAVAADAATVAPSPVPASSRSTAPTDLGWPLSAPASPTTAAPPTAGPGSAELSDDPDPSPTIGATRPTSTPVPASTVVPGVAALPLGTAEPSAGGGSPAGPNRDVVVHRGDTLWDIARRFLPAGASNAEIAAVWPAWYEANRATVGPDPDLILPGQVLTAPRASA